jgi:hypothetical protein
MTDTTQTDSVRLFFSSFTKHLERIRDDGKDAGQAYRAQILLGQLDQFEKAIVEYQGASLERGLEQRVLQSLLHLEDLTSFCHWLSDVQHSAPLAGLFYLDNNGTWQAISGEVAMPRNLRVGDWVQRGLLGRLAADERAHLAFVHGQPRLLLLLKACCFDTRTWVT